MTPGSPGDLLRRVRLAIDVAGRALHAVLAQGESRAADAASPCVRPLSPAKVIAEAAMLLRCVSPLRAADASLGDAIDTLAWRLAPHARSDSVLAQLCREPSCAIETAAAHVYLRDLGHPDEAFDSFLQEILDGEPVGGPERLANHALEHHWLTQVFRATVGELAVDAPLLARTCVAMPLDVLGSSTSDLYAFTHVVMYASDMGRRAVQWPRPVDEIADEAQAALAAALDADNFDLAAELLWTWPMLGLPWSAAARFAFGVLAEVQDEHGFLPGPEYVLHEHEARSDAQREDLVLRTSYHANFVMGILCAVALLPGRAPSPCSVDTPDDAGTPDELLRLLPASSRTPRWLAAREALDATCRSALAPFVLSIALRRAATAHDVERVRLCLQAALQGGFIDGSGGSTGSAGPALRQALALLRRATALARLVSVASRGEFTSAVASAPRHSGPSPRA